MGTLQQLDKPHMYLTLYMCMELVGHTQLMCPHCLNDDTHYLTAAAAIVGSRLVMSSLNLDTRSSLNGLKLLQSLCMPQVCFGSSQQPKCFNEHVICCSEGKFFSPFFQHYNALLIHCLVISINRSDFEFTSSEFLTNQLPTATEFGQCKQHILRKRTLNPMSAWVPTLFFLQRTEFDL